ncbi:MAG: hypothetical protein AB1760_15455, partial [Pseudomonadota bacterium]
MLRRRKTRPVSECFGSERAKHSTNSRPNHGNLTTVRKARNVRPWLMALWARDLRTAKKGNGRDFSRPS